MKHKAGLPRSRPIYLTLVVAVVILGLGTRRYRSELPVFIGEFGGDTLWATMVFLIAAAIWNRAHTRTLALGAVIFSFGIEASQLYQSPWINALRSTRLGGLLGHGFLWSDLLCYLAGVAMAIGADLVLSLRRISPHSPLKK